MFAPTLAAPLAVTALIMGVYAVVCALSPFGPCRRCDGFGFKLKTSRTGRMRRGKGCRRCRGTCRRLRLGRRLHNFARSIRQDATR